MQKKIPGTDGVRGRGGSWPITPYVVPQAGRPTGRHFIGMGRSSAEVIGQDKRLSGSMAQSALIPGSTSAGMDVVPTGPFPALAIDMLARSRCGDLGIMIPASHNPHRGNGGKFAGTDSRVHMIEKKGRIVEGDQLMALVTEHARAQGKLTHDTLVVTVLSSSGPDRYLTRYGICMARPRVGLCYVAEPVRTMGLTVVGRQQSGHVTLSKFGTTGDGLVSAPHGRMPVDQPEGIGVIGRMVRPTGSETLVRIRANDENPDLPAEIADEIGHVLNGEQHRVADLSPHPSAVVAGAAFVSTALQPALVQSA